jgi:peroxiredoxin
MTTRTIVFAVALLAGSCGGTQDPATGNGTGTGTGTGDPTKAADAGTDTTKPEPQVGLGQAPDATVIAEGGGHVQLSSAWLSGTAVLVFSRGHWCPFCIRQLTSFNEQVAEVEKLGAKVYAITADPEDPPKLRQKIPGLKLNVYSDPDLAAIKAYDVLDAGNNIAKPATVIVDSSGRITFRYAGDNAADTVLIGVVLSELQKLQGAAKPTDASK